MKDLLENNKLIAEFMGFTVHTDNISWFDNNFKPISRFSKLWNELMPVVEKINSFDKHGVVIHFNRTIISTHFKNKINIISSKKDESLINNTYKAVIEFIKWYNKNNKK